MEWNDTMQKSIPFHDFGMEWWDDFNLIIPFQYFPNVIHSSNYYKIDYHSFVKALPSTIKKVFEFGELRHAAYSQKTWFAAYDGKKDEFIVW